MEEAPLIESVACSKEKPKNAKVASCQTANEFAAEYLASQDLTAKIDIHWIKGTYQMPSTIQFFQPPSSQVIDLPSPLEFFCKYFTDELLESCAEKTNLYAVQNGVANFPPTNVPEVKTFFGILIIMGNLGYPRVRMYWEPKFAIPLIAENISVNRFFKLRNNMHFTSEEDKDSTDRLWKIRPLYNKIRERCHSLDPEEVYSVDEQMVPFKGSLNIKQYIKNKPTKWGVKLFLLCGVSGTIYDFIIYQGSSTELRTEYTLFGQGAAVVMQLSERIPSQCQLLFDNYFSSYWLFQWLSKKQIYAAGTIRKDRFSKPPFTERQENNRKLERGFMEDVICKNSGVVLTKWVDSSVVTLGSNFVGVAPPDTCQRWDKKSKEYVEVPRPKVVSLYNLGMGGVDKCDFLIALYRSFIRSKKWTVRLISHAVDMAVVNSWLEYRRTAENLGVPTKQVLDLIHFRQNLAEALILSGKLRAKKRGRPTSTPSSPSLVVNNPMIAAVTRKQVRPVEDVRFDNIGHMPIFSEKIGRCKKADCKSRTYIQCTKCNVSLCISRDQNCFQYFHTK